MSTRFVSRGPYYREILHLSEGYIVFFPMEKVLVLLNAERTTNTSWKVESVIHEPFNGKFAGRNHGTSSLIREEYVHMEARHPSVRRWVFVFVCNAFLVRMDIIGPAWNTGSPSSRCIMGNMSTVGFYKDLYGRLRSIAKLEFYWNIRAETSIPSNSSNFQLPTSKPSNSA